MISHGFQSFVAWRYLMARPRRWPRPIIVMIGMCVLASAFAYGVGWWLEQHWQSEYPRRPAYNGIVLAMSNIHRYNDLGLWILRGGGVLLVVLGLLLAKWKGKSYVQENARLPRHLRESPLGYAAVGGGAAGLALTAADLRSLRSTVGWTLLLGGAEIAAFGASAQYLTAEAPLSLVLTRQAWWIALTPLAVLIPLLFFRYLFTFFTTVSVAGVFIGSMALVVVLSIMGGFENDLRDKILGSNAHIRVTREEGMIADWRAVMAEIQQVPGVVAQTPYATTEVVLSANSNYGTVIIKGIDPESVGQVTELVQDIEGTPEEDAAAMKRLYPLRQDLSGEPDDVDDPAPPAKPPGDVKDPAPPDMTEGDEPLDYATEDDAGADAGADDTAEDDTTDPAPDDFAEDSEEPEDYGSVEPEELTADGGVAPSNVVKIQDLLDQADKEPLILDAPTDGGRLELLDGVLVGKELEKQLHLFTGQEVRLVSPLADPANPDATGTPIPFHRDYRIAGTFYTGMYEYDLKFVYVPLESLQEFLQLGDEIDGIEIRISDPEATAEVSARIRKVLGADYVVQDWKELNRNLFSALKLEKIAMFLVLAIIILVASFSIVGNLIMIVVEKQKEIALLKTLGASDFGVMRVFIMQGFFIGCVGTLVGVLEGLLICFGCKRLGFPINPDVYYIKTLPIHVEPLSVAAIAAAGLVISAVATVYPALIAARLRPAEGLRHD
jgi:lipoprotein-releasing system permease protein